MTIYITDDIKNRIYEISSQEGVAPDNLSLFEHIPPKKIKNAISKYASSLGSDETVILLHDATVFGSAKTGFILTSKRLYGKGTLEKAGDADVDSIIAMSLIGSDITVITQNREFKINVMSTAKDGKIALLNILYKTIKLLRNETIGEVTGIGQPHTDQILKCTGCGASNDSNANNCEYCKADLAEARKAMLSTAIVLEKRIEYILEVFISKFSSSSERSNPPPELIEQAIADLFMDRADSVKLRSKSPINECMAIQATPVKDAEKKITGCRVVIDFRYNKATSQQKETYVTNINLLQGLFKEIVQGIVPDVSDWKSIFYNVRL